MPEIMRGLYPIIAMPFDADYEVDYDSLRTLVDYLIEGGSHGLGVANGSEVLKLTERERYEVTRVMVEQAKGRVPIVINTSGSGRNTAICYSRAAAEAGADALMLMPPVAMGMGRAPSQQGLRDFLGAVADAIDLPIFVQSQGGTPVSPQLVRQVFDEHPNVCYLKEECMPAPPRISAAVKELSPEITVFGGAGGHHLIRELRRGSLGTMPGCAQPEAFRAVWDLYFAGDVAGAIEVHDKTMRMLSVTGLLMDGFFHVHKELLRQRGIIATANIRPPFEPWPDDEVVTGEIQEAIDAYLAWYP